MQPWYRRSATGFLSTIIAMSLPTCLDAWAGDRSADPLQAHSFTRPVSKTAAAHYLLYLPQRYAEETSRRWPLIVFLHGSGERGEDLATVKRHGLPKQLASHQELPFIVASPQLPSDADWDIDTLNALLDELLERLPIDPDRVYLTGLSLGGHATWRWATHNPERFAAIAPVCGAGWQSLACRLAHVPVWAFHGDQDPVVPFAMSAAMVNTVQSCGGDARLTTYPGSGHDAWSETYANPQLYTWFLQHRRRSQ